MNGSFLCQIMSLIYMISLIAIFFSKERIKSIEHKIFKVIAVVNLIGLVTEISCYISGLLDIKSSLLVKLYLIYLISFISLFTVYLVYISSDNQNVKNKNTINLIYYIFGSIIILILPINLINQNESIYADGPAVTMSYILITIYVVTWYIIIFKNIKFIINKKYLPLLFFLIIGTITMIMQRIYPELLFVDDNIDNVNGAKQLGINTIKVEKNTELIEEISKFID